MQKAILYICVGNGTVGTHDDPRALVNRGESFLKLMPRRGNLLQVTGLVHAQQLETPQ